MRPDDGKLIARMESVMYVTSRSKPSCWNRRLFVDTNRRASAHFHTINNNNNIITTYSCAFTCFLHRELFVDETDEKEETRETRESEFARVVADHFQSGCDDDQYNIENLRRCIKKNRFESQVRLGNVR